MCRFIVYVGEPITLESLITLPRNSLIHQSIQAEEFDERLNGDGFGVAWYAPEVSAEPAVFRGITPAWSNRNLLSLVRVVRSPCILAHVRAATPGMAVTETNCHPFARGAYAFLHNGHVGDFAAVRRPLRRALTDASYDAIEGSTDSELLFALFLDCMLAHSRMPPAEGLAGALEATIHRVLDLQREFGTGQASYLNLGVTDGVHAAATRFTDGAPEDALSLYYHSGRRYVCDGEVCRMVPSASGTASTLICSERLSDDGGWTAVPANHLVMVQADRTVAARPIRTPGGA
ncbi:MAG: class II glutamine amidotransferase [Planctomycetota bacterium]